MAYELPAHVIRPLFDNTLSCCLPNYDRTNYKLFEGDKQKVETIYPKPAGGSTIIHLDGSSWHCNVEFFRHQLTTPRIVLGFWCLEWDPLASSDATMELSKT